jgi:serine protease Do
MLIHNFNVTIVTIFTCLLLISHLNAESDQKSAIGSSSKPDIPDAGPIGTIFSTIAEKTIPVVVSVIPTKYDTVIEYQSPFKYFFGDSYSQNPFDYFFGSHRNGQRKGVAPPFEEKQYRVVALGSGVIISPDGLILSNYHVIQGARDIEVLLSDGKNYAAKIVGSDSLADVAVLKINGKINNLPVAYFGNSDNLKPGDWVMAVGNPFALMSTVTVGVVSALNRQVESPNMYENFIQTDAAINPGNSGGALVNIKGEIIGINTMIYTQSGGFMGIGFAVPINMARRDAEDIISKGHVVRGWIGLTSQDITQTTREALKLPGNNGALVSDVIKDQPADQAGIRAGDVIISVNNKPVRDVNDLRNKVAEIKPGETVPISIIRQGKEMKLSIKVVERTPQRLAAGTAKPATGNPNVRGMETFGIDVANLTPEIRQRTGIPQNVNGVIVIEVNQSVMDERTALKPDDVIERIKIDGNDFQDIKSVDHLKKEASGTKSGEPVLMLINRGNNRFFISFKTP